MPATLYVEHGLVRWDGMDLAIIAPPRRWTGLEADFLEESVLVLQPLGQGSYDEDNPVARTVDIQPSDARVVWEQFGVEITNTYTLFDTPEAGVHVMVLLKEKR